MDSSEMELEQAKKYFWKQVEICSVDRVNSWGIESFFDYVKHDYQDSCHYYSTYALMGLKTTDKLVRGNLQRGVSGHTNYPHGWVEFEYQGQDYVFDAMIVGNIVHKTDWYAHFDPKVVLSFTKQEVLDLYLKDSGNQTVTDSKIYKISTEYQPKYPTIADPLKNALVEVESGKVKKFLAYLPQNG